MRRPIDRSKSHNPRPTLPTLGNYPPPAAGDNPSEKRKQSGQEIYNNMTTNWSPANCGRGRDRTGSDSAGHCRVVGGCRFLNGRTGRETIHKKLLNFPFEGQQ